MPNMNLPSPEELQAKNLESQNKAFASAELAKQQTELIRFKQNCRTKAFDWAMEKDFSGGDEHVIKKANQYYEWLTKDLS